MTLVARERAEAYASVDYVTTYQEIRYEGRTVAFVRGGDVVVDRGVTGETAELVRHMARYAVAVGLGWADGPYTDEDALADARLVYRAQERWLLGRAAFVAAVGVDPKGATHKREPSYTGCAGNASPPSMTGDGATLRTVEPLLFLDCDGVMSPVPLRDHAGERLIDPAPSYFSLGSRKPKVER